MHCYDWHTVPRNALFKSKHSKEQTETKNLTNRGLGLNLKLNPAGRCTGSF